jgi:hypothetical protein
MKGIYFIRYETYWPFMKLIKVSYNTLRYMTLIDESSLNKNSVFSAEVQDDYNSADA